MNERDLVVLRAVREVLIVLGLAMVGYVVAGFTGAMVAGAAVVAGRAPAEHPGKPVAMAACLLLAAAAAATVLEATPGERPVSLAFPLERELAGDLGAAAGILLLAAIVTSAAAERATDPASASPDEPAGDALPPWRWSLAGLAVLGVALLVRLVAAPAALASGLDPVVHAVAGGQALVVAGLGLVAPAAPVVAALGPGGGTVALVVAGVLLVGLVGLLADRLGGLSGTGPGPTGAFAAAGVAAVLPSLWLLDLAGVLAALAAVGAVLLAEPRRSTVGRGVGAGLLALLALLARPDAIVLGPVLVAWLLLAAPGDRRSRRQRRAAWATGTAWTVALGCWTLVVHEQVDSWNPLRSLGPEGGGTASGVAIAVVVALDLLAVVAAVLAVRGLARRIVVVLPLVVLPLWCALAALVLDASAAGFLSWGSPFVAVLAGWYLGRGAHLAGPLGDDQVVARTSS